MWHKFTCGTCDCGMAQPPGVWLYILYIQTLQAKRKPALRRAGWLEQCHCKPQTYVKYWCYDDGGYLGVLLAELFHLILLGWEPDCSGSLGLLHCDSDVVHRDSVVDQLLLELKGLLVPFEPAKED